MHFIALQKSYQQRYLRSGYSCHHHLSHYEDSNCDSHGIGQSQRGGPSCRSSRRPGGVVKATENLALRAFREEARTVRVLLTCPSTVRKRVEDSSLNRCYPDGGDLMLSKLLLK